MKGLKSVVVLLAQAARTVGEPPMSDDPTQQKKWGLATLICLIATALLFFSFFLPWFGWSWSCNGSDCQAVTLSLKTHPPVSSGFSVASNGVSLVSASASAPGGDRGGIAVNIDNISIENNLSLLLGLVLLVAIVSRPLSSILMNFFRTSGVGIGFWIYKSQLSSLLMNLFKTSERGLHTQQSTQESAQPPIVPDSSPSPTRPWKKWGLATLIAFFFFLFVANNGFSLVATCAPVGDRAVFAVNTASFRFPLLWLVLGISLVLFLSHILLTRFKTVARWEQPFTLSITAVALYVELLYLVSTFGVVKPIVEQAPLFSFPTCSGEYISGYSLHAFLSANILGVATLHLSHGPSFGFWLGLLATLVVGGVGVVKGGEAQRASSRGRHLPHGASVLPVQEFALDAAGTRRVQVLRATNRVGEPLTVLLDQSPIGSLSQEELVPGREFPLKDGSVLKVHVVNNQVQVLRNGLTLTPVAAQPELMRRQQGEGPAGCLAFYLISLGIYVLLVSLAIFLAGDSEYTVYLSPTIVLAVLIVDFVVAQGLWKLQRWAYWATAVILALIVIGFIFVLRGHIYGSLDLSFGIIAPILLIYLFASRKARAAFGVCGKKRVSQRPSSPSQQPQHPLLDGSPPSKKRSSRRPRIILALLAGLLILGGLGATFTARLVSFPQHASPPHHASPTPGSSLVQGLGEIIAGPDGNLWFTVFSRNPSEFLNNIGRITTQGSITEFALPQGSSPNTARGLIVGPDGAIWFLDGSSNRIGRITTQGSITEFALPTKGSSPNWMIAGPDGALWFTEYNPDKIGRITTQGSITEFALPTKDSSPEQVIAGPDGALWFTEGGLPGIGRITTKGRITEFATPPQDGSPNELIAGPDGALWFTETQGNTIGRLTTQGSITEFALPTKGSSPYGLIAGPDGALWFAEYASDKIGRITTQGSITEFALPQGSSPYPLIAGPDGALWFFDSASNSIGRITTKGRITEFAIPTKGGFLYQLIAGPDGALWFAEYASDKIGRITTQGSITEFVLPT